MNAYFRGEPLVGPGGPAGPDGNPVGTVISFMGTGAPKDYLVCDGAEYSVSEYPALAEFFREQFGEVHHFGGDGTATFAVPDLRNLFLRGYHGEAEEPLSGEVGQRQEATELLMPFSARGSTLYSIGITKQLSTMQYLPSNIDQRGDEGPQWVAFICDDIWQNANTLHTPTTGTTRPVNMAVLFCIKAVESAPAENVYSTEETRIGTWIDGKPLYQRSVHKDSLGTLTETRGTYNITSLTVVELKKVEIMATVGDQRLVVPYIDNDGACYLTCQYWAGNLQFVSKWTSSKAIAHVDATLYYTKTTD